MTEPGDESEDLVGGIPVRPAWACYTCGLVFDVGKPDTCPVGAVGCDDLLAESE